MINMNIHEAKTNFSSLINTVQRLRENAVIYKHGEAVAQIVPIPQGNRLNLDPVLKNIKIKDNPTKPTTEEWLDA